MANIHQTHASNKQTPTPRNTLSFPQKPSSPKRPPLLHTSHLRKRRQFLVKLTRSSRLTSRQCRSAPTCSMKLPTLTPTPPLLHTDKKSPEFHSRKVNKSTSKNNKLSFKINATPQTKKKHMNGQSSNRLVQTLAQRVTKTNLSRTNLPMKNTPSANDLGHNHLILTPHYSYPYPQCLNINESNHPIFISTPKDLIFLIVIPYPSRSSTHIRFSFPLLPYIPRLDASPISLRPYNTSSTSIRTPIRIAPSPFLSAKCSTTMFVFADNYSLNTQISTASPAFTSITSQSSTPQQFAISVDRAIPRSLSRQVNTLTHLLSHSPHSLQAPSDSIQFMSNNNGQDPIICNRSNGYLKDPGSPTLHRTCTHNTLTLDHTLHSSTHLPTTLEQPPSPSPTARLPYRLPNPLQESNHEIMRSSISRPFTPMIVFTMLGSQNAH